jgi:uncharacterized membrane protein YhaH (DUF805 family)
MGKFIMGNWPWVLAVYIIGFWVVLFSIKYFDDKFDKNICAEVYIMLPMLWPIVLPLAIAVIPLGLFILLMTWPFILLEYKRQKLEEVE